MGSPLRILHVVVNMNNGGAETLIMNLYRNIDRSKVQFDFLTCKKGVFDEEICQLGGKIHRIPYISEVGHFKYINALNSFFTEKNHYQIVHSHMDKMSGFVLRAAKKAGIPIRISHSHNTSSEGGKIAQLYKWYAGKFILSSSTHLFACSEQASKWMFGMKAENAIILKNGVDLEKFKYNPEDGVKIRKELNINNECFVIGHIGRFCTQKNHTFLIDIFAEIVNKNSNSKLILIGDGPLKKQIIEKVKKKGLNDDVLFLGVRSDVNLLLNMMNVLVFPSLHEGLPLTLIEAQGTGVPCVVSDVISEEVDLGIGLITFENINDLTSKWAEKIIFRNDGIKDTSEYVRKNGYDITETAKWLQSFYVNLNRKNVQSKESA